MTARQKRAARLRPGPSATKLTSASEVAALITAYASGLTLRDCAAAHDVSYGTVRRALLNAGVSLRRPHFHPDLAALPAAGDELYTTDEVARLFGVTRKTVTLWASEGKLTGIKTPGGGPRTRWRWCGSARNATSSWTWRAAAGSTCA